MKQNFKPILFSSPMVQAILEDRKDQTRRIIKPQPDAWITASQGSARVPYKITQKNPSKNNSVWVEDDGNKYEPIETKVKIGDILWVRETWFYTRYDWKYLLKMGVNHIIKYKADNNYDPKKDCVGRSWKPSIHMPKIACRIFLEVTNVRVERLQDISEGDAIAEGIKLLGLNGRDNKIYKNYMDKGTMESGFEKPLDSFISLWHSINGIESWIANPWVWVYDFKRVEKPENFLES